MDITRLNEGEKSMLGGDFIWLIMRRYIGECYDSICHVITIFHVISCSCPEVSLILFDKFFPARTLPLQLQ